MIAGVFGWIMVSILVASLVLDLVVVPLVVPPEPEPEDLDWVISVNLVLLFALVPVMIGGFIVL